MTVLAVLLIAAVGRLAFGALAHAFRPAHRPLCQPVRQYAALHRAEG